MSADRLFLGIDGGATHVRALAVNGRGEAVGYGEGGPCSLSCYPPQLVESSLRKAVHGALLSSDTAGVAWTVAGVAGASLPDVAAGYADILRRLGLAEADVTTDAEAALAGGCPSGDAIVLIAGTGSMALGRNRDGRNARSGGWGHALGDAGSGAWVGQRAVDAALRGLEDRGPRVSFTESLVRTLGLGDMAEIKREAAGGRMTPARFASLAIEVSRAAAQGDAVAAQIMDEAAHEMALLAASVGRQLGFGSAPIPVVKAGGMFRLNGSFAEDIQRYLGAMMNEAVLVDPEMSPVQGAALLALSHAGLAGPEVLERLKGWRSNQ